MMEPVENDIKQQSTESLERKLRPLTSMYYKPVKEGFMIKRGT
jgi:hypothetical protein